MHFSMFRSTKNHGQRNLSNLFSAGQILLTDSDVTQSKICPDVQRPGRGVVGLVMTHWLTWYPQIPRFMKCGIEKIKDCCECVLVGESCVLIPVVNECPFQHRKATSCLCVWPRVSQTLIYSCWSECCESFVVICVSDPGCVWHVFYSGSADLKAVREFVLFVCLT